MPRRRLVLACALLSTTTAIAPREGLKRSRAVARHRGGAVVEGPSENEATWLGPAAADPSEISGSADDDDHAEDARLATAQRLKAAADARQRAGDWDAAARGYAEALDAPLAETPEGARLAASCYANLARCCSKQGQHARAVECCDTALRLLEAAARSSGTATRSLRAAALYRRAVAKSALGATRDAWTDATRAAALGDRRAAPLVRDLAPSEPLLGHHPMPPPSLVPSSSSRRRRPTSRPPGIAALSRLVADPARVAAFVPLAKTFATPDALRGMGLDPARADSLAALVQRLDRDDVERWVKRARALLAFWRRASRVLSMIKRSFPYAVYATVTGWMATDSIVGLLRHSS